MKAHVEWDGYYWVANLEGGGVTQAKRLDQLPSRLVEVAKLMHGVEVDPTSIELDVKVQGDLGHKAAEVAVRRRRLVEDTAELAKTLRKEGGLSLRDIGKLLDISYQRVGQIVSDTTSPKPSPPPKQLHPDKLVGSPPPMVKKSAAFKSARRDGMRPAAKASRPAAARKGGAS